MKIKLLTIITVAGFQLSFHALAADSSTDAQAAEIEALKNEVQTLAAKVDALENQRTNEQSSPSYQALDQKVRTLERERENDADAAAALAKTQPKISLSANGFSFSSADTNFVASLHGIIQADSRTFFADHGRINGNDSFLLRRARPILTGTVFHDFDFNFTPDFGGSTVQIVDAFLNYHFNSALQLEAGKFKSPVGLEHLVADRDLLFNERSLATDLVPNRDLGVELHGDVFNGILSYAAGIFDGAPDYNGTTFNADTDDEKAFAGRAFVQPFKTLDVAPLHGLGIGAGGSYEYDRNGASGLTPGYLTDGQQKFFTYGNTVTPDGTHWRISPQGYYYYGPFGLLSEYVISDQRVTGGTITGKKPVALRNTAWEISSGWVLTGEDMGYNGVTPLHPFSLHNGHWGAWQIVARYATLDVDQNAFKDGFANLLTSASEARAWAVGLNWYLNRNVRVNTSFSRTLFTGGTGPTATVTKQPENVLFTRIQLAF